MGETNRQSARSTRRTAGNAGSGGEVRNDVFAEKGDRFFYFFVRDAAHLHHAEHVLDTDPLVPLDLTDAGIGVADAEHASIDGGIGVVIGADSSGPIGGG